MISTFVGGRIAKTLVDFFLTSGYTTLLLAIDFFLLGLVTTFYNLN